MARQFTVNKFSQLINREECLASIIIREMQIKTISCHLLPGRFAKY